VSGKSNYGGGCLGCPRGLKTKNNALRCRGGGGRRRGNSVFATKSKEEGIGGRIHFRKLKNCGGGEGEHSSEDGGFSGPIGVQLGERRGEEEPDTPVRNRIILFVVLFTVG